ncbi:MAG: hypothetical protein K0R13_1697, partial [Propionibacteriaceae bacterium]|nr:hypothetical protein [Propionibacteriaceae bacterium]
FPSSSTPARERTCTFVPSTKHMLQRVYRARNARARAFPQVRERGEGDEGVGVRETGRIQFGMRPVLLDANRLGLELFVGGFGAFVEAFDDAAELHGRYVRSCRTRCAREGERVL